MFQSEEKNQVENHHRRSTTSRDATICDHPPQKQSSQSQTNLRRLYLWLLSHQNVYFRATAQINVDIYRWSPETSTSRAAAAPNDRSVSSSAICSKMAANPLLSDALSPPNRRRGKRGQNKLMTLKNLNFDSFVAIIQHISECLCFVSKKRIVGISIRKNWILIF